MIFIIHVLFNPLHDPSIKFNARAKFKIRISAKIDPLPINKTDFVMSTVRILIGCVLWLSQALTWRKAL